MASRKSPKESGKRKRSPPSTRPRRTPSSAKVGLPSQLEAARQDLREARAREAAVSEVLAAIGRAGSDPQPVFDLALSHAVRLSGAGGGNLWLREGEEFRHVGAWSDDGRSLVALTAYYRQRRHPVTGAGVSGRVYRVAAAVQIEDVTLDPDYPKEQLQYIPEYHTLLGVPLLKDGAVVGVLALSRRAVKLFTDHEISVVQTFADQAGLALENARLLNETTEGLERQTAISGILSIISSSPTNVQPVLEAIAESARRFCVAEDAIVCIAENGLAIIRAHTGPVPPPTPFVIDRTAVVTRSMVDRTTIHVTDVQAEGAEYPVGSAQAKVVGAHTMVATPLMREGEAIGAILLRRAEVRPFTGRQVELLRTFAAQAAIAIENVRLLNETTEGLERQTALAEVLRSIAGSPTDAQPVLDAIAANAARFSGAENAVVLLRRDDGLVPMSHHGPDAGYSTEPLRMDRSSIAATAMLDRRTVHVPDIFADDAAGFTQSRARQAASGLRGMLAAPLLREGSAIGAILLRRNDVAGFTPRQIELVEAFADQAVIAIENVRLFNETKEALDRQTATSRVLEVISRSAFDLQRVLDTVAENAARLCGASRGVVWRFDGEARQIAAMWSAHEVSDELRAAFARIPERPDFARSVVARAADARHPVQTEDAFADPTYPTFRIEGASHTRLGVPLLRDDRLIGVLLVARDDVRPFTPQEIQLVQTFADQAVIAIENVRLFNETREALERQTATSEVLKAISDSAFELQPMFDTMLRTAARICRADYGFLYHIWDARDLSSTRMVASFNVPEEEVRRNREINESATGAFRSVNVSRGPLSVESFRAAVGSVDRLVQGSRSLLANRVFLAGATVHVPEIADDPDLAANPTYQRLSIRALLGVPMLRGNDIGGAITLTKKTPGPFDESAIKLVESFADQAMIAIENARLVGEIEAASRHKSEFLANMSHELRTPLNAIIGFSDVLEQRLFGELNDKQADYTRDIASSGRHLLDLVNEILDLSKVEAGRMELESSEFALVETIRGAMAFVRERAAGHGIELEAALPEDLGTVVADERKIRQVLLNLFSNAVKFTPDGGRIAVRARRMNDEIQIAVQDTGIGIAPEDQARVFEEFRQVGKTSDRSREGTGLGLTLAKRFIELHGGRIWIDSKVGKGTTFTFALPLGSATPAPT